MKKINNIYTDYITIDKPLNKIDYKYVIYHDNKYCDNLMACDIETTSAFIYYDKPEAFIPDIELNDKKHERYALCYFWSACIQDDIINSFYGRTLESFKKFVDELTTITESKLIIYIHNASFEFQFFRNVFNDMSVFARKIRKPIYFTWKNVDFRCSYMLIRLSLENWAITKELPHQKMIGSLNYNKIRTPFTNMTKEEIEYGLVDSIIVIEGLREYKDRYKHVYAIPLTQTGIVRKEVNQLLVKETKLHRKNKDNYPDNLEYYNELVSIFSGGLTLANYIYVDKLMTNLKSRDATSAYPWQMLSKLFPSTRFLETQEIGKYIDNPYCLYYLEVEYYDIKSLFWLCYISISKCIKTNGVVCVNGRVQSADYLRIRVCNTDYEIITRSYTARRKKILNFKYAIASPLNNTFRKYLLKLFQDKCTLDGINPELYLKSKESFNSMYGNFVTKDIVDDILYEYNKWDIKKLNPELFDAKVEKILEKMYKLNFSYAQGIYVPAYQRQSLWSFVYELDSQIVYMDTDSHKYISDEYAENVFETYNKNIRLRQEELAKELNVDITLFRPLTPKGIQKSIGEYTEEKPYKEFKTLGAKRYAYRYMDDSIHITVSGVNKKKGASQLKSLEEFKEGYTFDYEHSGSLTMTYLDNMESICYNKGQYDEFISFYRYGICSEPSTYTTKLLKEYRDLIVDLKYSQTQLIMEKDNVT